MGKEIEMIKNVEEPEINIEIKDDVSIAELMEVIDTIVDAVVAQDFDYSLIDLLESYYILKFFTDVEIIWINEEKLIPDYIDCYKKCVEYDVIDQLCAVSPAITKYIGYLETNIWRKLEYRKTLIAHDRLMTALDDFQSVIDFLNTVGENVAGIDEEKITGLLEQINSINESIEQVKKSNISTGIAQ